MLRMRAAILAAVLVAGLAAVWWLARRSPAPPAELPRLAYVTTARQLGVVGYRDPVGALSPDGRLVAYSEGRHVRIVPAAGGAVLASVAAESQVRHLAWLDDRQILFEDAAAKVRWWRAGIGAAPSPLWSVEEISGPGSGLLQRSSVRPNDLRLITASPDAAWIAGVAMTKEGPEMWKVSLDGRKAEARRFQGRLAPPAWMPSGDVACLVSADGRGRVSAPCGASPTTPRPDVDVVGPIAFSPDGATIYFASPNDRGFVDLWSMSSTGAAARRLTSFARDSYAPVAARDGTVLFKTQTYRTVLAELTNGSVRQLTSFQAETPWWHPREPLLSMTYGTWRRVVDDAKYPDIAQDIGVIDASRDGMAGEPLRVISQTDSEDQAMAWSPNGAWIAMHTHREMSDDVWLRAADGSSPDRRITFLGRGAEVGWPRWSPDGKTVLLDGANKQGRSALYVIGVDQDTGKVTSELRELATPGFEGDITHGEWLPDGRRVIAIAKVAPGRHAVVSVPVAPVAEPAAAAAAPAAVAVTVHAQIATEHDFPGLTVHPDGRSFVFVAPAPDGHYQLFRQAFDGQPEQLTTDPTHKTQPAWSPDGRRLAFTIWSYEAAFWTFRP
jgi:dipeptidyl aminopeptidase/acylaminoacyl peptidase